MKKPEIQRGCLAKSPKLESGPSDAKFRVLSTIPCGYKAREVLRLAGYPPENCLEYRWSLQRRALGHQLTMFGPSCQFSSIQVANQHQNQQEAGPALLILPCTLPPESVSSLCGQSSSCFQIHTSGTRVFCRTLILAFVEKVLIKYMLKERIIELATGYSGNTHIPLIFPWGYMVGTGIIAAGLWRPQVRWYDNTALD